MRQHRIAFIWPNDGLNDDEFWAYLPHGMSWLTTRFPGTLEGHDLDLETFRASAELGPMVAAARLMRPTKPDVVALGDHAGSFIMGPGEDLRQAKAIAKAAGAASGTTPSTAMVEALRHFGAKRLAVTSPYNREVTKAGVAYLEAHGFEVLAIEHASFSDEHDIAGQDAAHWRALAMRVDHPKADAIALLGCGIRTAGMLSGLELDTGKPVVPATAALVWHACMLVGRIPHKPGMGRLFEVPVAIRQSSHLHKALHQHLSSGTKNFSLSETPPLFVQGEGTWLIDTTGKRYLDFACGSGTTVLGHRHPAVLQALRGQLESGITHLGPHFCAPVQIALMECLASVLPPELSAFHPATNGTEAVEAAIKAAIHFTGHRRFVAFEGAYHGRTIGSLALSHARGRNTILGHLNPITTHLPYPTTSDEFHLFLELIDKTLASQDIAAVIVEPVQATAGMRVPHCGLLHALRAATSRAGVLLIVDEVFTGYGRTGRLFGFELSESGGNLHGDDPPCKIIPDLIVLAKAASGGVPGAVLAGRPEILQTWNPGVQSSTFQMHPLSAVASRIVLEELKRQDYQSRAIVIGRRMRETIENKILDHFSFGGISGVGAMIGLSIVDAHANPDQSLAKAIRTEALKNGLITWECGTHGHVIGLVPPLTVSDAEIDQAIDRLAHALLTCQAHNR